MRTLLHSCVLLLAIASSVFSADPVWVDALCNVYRGQGAFVGRGTGVLVAEENGVGYALTNRHVVASARTVRCVWENGYEVQGEVIWSEHWPDLAVIRMAIPEGTPVLPIADKGESPQRGERVTVAGFGGVPKLSIWSSQVTGYEMLRTLNFETVILETINIGGDSGGAVIYNDRLLAVMWGGRAIRTGIFGKRQIDTRGTLASYVYNACPT
jgi:S1-C subfamily serine protease